MSIDFKAQAEALREELIARRRDFHRHPELAFEEVRTAGIVADELTRLGLEVRAGVGRTGVIGVLEGAHDGPTVLLRADMDALPIQEENQVEFASQIVGKMHACGHDGHTAIALGVAKLLAPLRERMAGRVKFVFQPAEEIGEGAMAMIADGALDDPRPDVSVGLHLWNSLPSGMVGIADGAVMSGASIFRLKVIGKGGHGASPHQTIDPVVCASQIVLAFQTIISRSLDPLDHAVISVTYLRAGEAYNVIPQHAELRGTVRYFSSEARDMLVRRMHETAEYIAQGMGCSAQLEIDHLTKPVINDAAVCARLREVFQPIVGSSGIDTSVRTMGSEDVSEFMEAVPGVYFFVGAKDETADAYYGHHHPRFTIDEEALTMGVALLSSAVASYVLTEG
jgi:amidohydrolase